MILLNYRDIKMMRTFSKIYVKGNDVDGILVELKEYFNIGEIELLDESICWYYSGDETETIILSGNYLWCEIELEFNYSVYFYDEFLRRLSAKFNTLILLGYYQTATGNGRIARFEKGLLDLSLNQTHDRIDEVCLTDNFGLTKQMQQEFKIPKLGELCKIIDCGVINIFFKSNGLPVNDFKVFSERKYLHVKKINSFSID